MRKLTRGTPNFPNIRAAYDYFNQYGFNRQDVDAKLERGEIYTTRPTLAKGEKLTWFDDYRYGIEWSEK